MYLDVWCRLYCSDEPVCSNGKVCVTCIAELVSVEFRFASSLVVGFIAGVDRRGREILYWSGGSGSLWSRGLYPRSGNPGVKGL